MRKFLPNIKVESPFSKNKRASLQVRTATTNSLDDNDDDRSERSSNNNNKRSSKKLTTDKSPTPTNADKLKSSSSSTSLLLQMNGNTGTIPFTSVSEVKRSIQQEKDLLIILGYGVEYIPPTKSSLEALLEFGKDPGIEYRDRIKIILIDEEVNRKFCNENNLVVGTPILQMYYNSKNIKFRFEDSMGKSMMMSGTTDESSVGGTNKKGSSSTKTIDEDHESRPRNVYIGQLHYSIINALVALTFDAISDAEEEEAEDIIVDVDMAILRGEIELDAEADDKFDSSVSDETDSGEETEDDSDDDSVNLEHSASNVKALDDEEFDDETSVRATN